MCGLKERTNSDNKQPNKRNEQHKKKEKKRYSPNPTRFSKRFFTCSLPVSILKFY